MFVMPLRKPCQIGARFGRLTVIDDLGTARGRSYAMVRCDCGKEFKTKCKYLYCGDTLSCGCLRRDNWLATIALPQTREARRNNGRKNVESGHLARIRNLPQTKIAQRIAGLKAGRRSVESGHLDRIRELPQTKAAQRESGHINGCMYGRANGYKAVKSRQLSQARKRAQETWNGSPENLQVLARINADSQKVKWSSTGGQARVKSGNLGYGIQCVTEDGISVKSIDEAIFWSICGGSQNVVYEPETVTLETGETYTYDFILKKPRLGIPSGVPIELRPAHSYVKWNPKRKEKFDKFKRQRPDAVEVFASELWS